VKTHFRNHSSYGQKLGTCILDTLTSFWVVLSLKSVQDPLALPLWLLGRDLISRNVDDLEEHMKIITWLFLKLGLLWSLVGHDNDTADMLHTQFGFVTNQQMRNCSTNGGSYEGLALSATCVNDTPGQGVSFSCLAFLKARATSNTVASLTMLYAP
jgi:hypothetical protein